MGENINEYLYIIAKNPLLLMEEIWNENGDKYEGYIVNKMRHGFRTFYSKKDKSLFVG